MIHIYQMTGCYFAVCQSWYKARESLFLTLIWSFFYYIFDEFFSEWALFFSNTQVVTSDVICNRQFHSLLAQQGTASGLWKTASHELIMHCNLAAIQCRWGVPLSVFESANHASDYSSQSQAKFHNTLTVPTVNRPGMFNSLDVQLFLTEAASNPVDCTKRLLML